MQFEQNYLALLSEALTMGATIDNDRTGVGTLQLTGKSLVAPNVGEQFPTLTTRPTPFRIAFWETMMFLNGITDTKYLEEKEIDIWKGNTTREFLDKRGLIHVPEGDMGKGYGFQWRNFNGNSAHSGGVDQIRELLTGLEQDPFGRRHLVTSWNPAQLGEMALPPCHILNQYMVVPDREKHGTFDLDSTFYMRSCDMVYGLPFNMMSYAFLNIIFADYLNNTKRFMKEGWHIAPGKVVFMGGDCHVYKNQVPLVQTQLMRTPLAGTSLKLAFPITSFDKLLNLTYAKDIRIASYSKHPKIEGPAMAV